VAGELGACARMREAQEDHTRNRGAAVPGSFAFSVSLSARVYCYYNSKYLECQDKIPNFKKFVNNKQIKYSNFVEKE
jgi:hypothetical protein